jgi:hypothetical protein
MATSHMIPRFVECFSVGLIVVCLNGCGQESESGHAVSSISRGPINAPRARAQIFGPPSYSGKPVVGGLNQVLTDGRLGLTVTAAVKRSYYSFHGPHPKVPFQYEIHYALDNPGDVAISASRHVTYFFEESGVLACAFERRPLKLEGNDYTDNDEPFVYEPHSRVSETMSSRGECRTLNNVCLHVHYEDGSESMFIVLIPSEIIVDEVAKQ